MKKLMTLVVALLFVFTLSACGNDDVIADLQSAVDNLQTQLNASDVDVADLEAAKDDLLADVAALQGELDALETENTDLQAEVTALQASLQNEVTTLSETIALLSSTLDETSDAFDLAITSANDQIAELLAQLEAFQYPIIYGITEYEQSIYEDLEYKLNVFDIQEGDLTSKLVMVTPGSFDEVGTYTVTFSVTDGDDRTTELEVTVEVGIPDNVMANYLSGVDLSRLDGENKTIIFTALENYLLENVYGGVPLYRGATYVMYSDRVSLYSPDYNGVMGFGNSFSELTEDDSNVLMYDDLTGNAGEYTWRASYENDHTSLNNWTADDSVSQDFINLYTGSLYSLYFDASKTGYEILPDLAASSPIPINGVEKEGRIYANKWKIEIKENLIWSYHEDTDISSLPADHEVLDANDYYDTWKYAIEQEWFRAISGGGDFITNGVTNVSEFVEGTADWEDVGIKLIDDNTIEIEFDFEKSMFDVTYAMVNNWTPINMDLVNELDALWGQGPDSIASSGVYRLDTYTPLQEYYFGKNENHPNAGMYHFTAKQFRYMSTIDLQFEEFLEGRLDTVYVPTSRVGEFINDPRIMAVTGPTTFSLNINSFGTEENRDAYIAEYPDMGLDSNFVPEPILQYVEMRQALQFGIDRYEMAVNIGQTYIPAFTYFAPTYFVDAESGISIRGTEEGQAIIDTYGLDNFGYNPETALAYFKEAVGKAINDGFYSAGNEENPTIIELSLTYMPSGNIIIENMIEYLETQYETLLYDNENHVGIDIVLFNASFPYGYYTGMMNASFDLGLGGISGSLLCPFNFLDTFADDNRSGFTLNWGIDTTTANIPIVYRGLDGVVVNETWSYNAMISAMVGKIYVKDGQEQVAFDSNEDLINAYLDMEETTIDSIEVPIPGLMQYIIGMTPSAMALEGGYDSVHETIVVDSLGGNYLFVTSELDGQFELLEKIPLFLDVTIAIAIDANYPLGSNNGELIDDAAVAADIYLQGLGFTSLQEIADYTDVPLEYMEVYSVTWAGPYDGTDAYVVLHIGNYYIPIMWL